MKRTNYLFLLGFTGILLLVTACGRSEAVDVHAESGVESEHQDDAQQDDAQQDDAQQDDAHQDDAHLAEGEHSEAVQGMNHLHVEAPEEFAALENPFAGDQEAIAAGQETFNTLCVTCHGAEGKGDGPGSAALDPQPADLSNGMMMSMLSDGYLFWRVSKGGALDPFNSAMPAWESGLTEAQRWQVISYIRTLSDGHGSTEQNHMDGGHMDGGHMDGGPMDGGHMDGGPMNGGHDN